MVFLSSLPRCTTIMQINTVIHSLKMWQMDSMRQLLWWGEPRGSGTAWKLTVTQTCCCLPTEPCPLCSCTCHSPLNSPAPLGLLSLPVRGCQKSSPLSWFHAPFSAPFRQVIDTCLWDYFLFYHETVIKKYQPISQGRNEKPGRCMWK